ncbi:MAG TPA: PHP domain-containing protein, partial [Pseudomonadales bacterium]|nr:PHP domain-containing protein [Pseudomonadales bacterium]
MNQAHNFVHLRLHSEYSLVDGLVRIKPLVKKVAALGMPAVAVTDHVNLFASVKFQKAAMAAGIKPIMGADILVRRQAGDKASLLTLLIQNAEGYKNLVEIISTAYLQGQEMGLPLCTFETVAQHAAGLIALSGGAVGEVGQALLAGQFDEAQQFLASWQTIFPQRYYLEISRTGRAQDERHVHAVVDLASRCHCPVVASNDVRFLEKEQFGAHETRVCIGEGRVLDDQSRPRLYSDQQYLRSPEEMIALFADLPEAIINTVEIAKRCSFSLVLGKNYLPNYPVPAGKSLENYFSELA